MSANVQSGLQFIELQPRDLDDPRLVRLNSLIRDLVGEIQRLSGMHGAIGLVNDLDLQGHSIQNAANMPAAANSASTSSPVAANLVLAGPYSSQAPGAVPTFRKLISDDLPYFDALKINTGVFKSDRIPTLAATKVTPASGITASRPATPATGFVYFDTTLAKPVWFKGPGWVDATGGAA